jgi:hypothetical protein
MNIRKTLNTFRETNKQLNQNEPKTDRAVRELVDLGCAKMETRGGPAGALDFPISAGHDFG